MKDRRGILWFRQDLRLHDNEALHDAIQHCQDILPLYVFDPRQFQQTKHFDFEKTGERRTQFLLECVEALRERLLEKGSDLVIRVGYPEEVIFELAQEIKSSWVFCNRERTEEEVLVQDHLEKNMWTIGQEVRYSRGKMLYYTQDLPWPVTQTPESFSVFKKEMEWVSIRAPLEEPDMLNAFTYEGDRGDIPSMRDFGFDTEPEDTSFRGGEDVGLRRLEQLAKRLTHKETVQDSDVLSRHPLSPWLSQGCLSPKLVHRHLGDFKEVHSALMWRDFYRLMGKKHGNRIFQLRGLSDAPPQKTSREISLIRIWTEGRTGIPIIDATMTELNDTGFIPYKNRLIAANFLIHYLHLDWRIGAEYFESRLIDYDPCSNYGNWGSVAAVNVYTGNERPFNIMNQAQAIDPDGDYVRHWIPAIEGIASNRIHHPNEWQEAELKEAGVRVGVDYPKAMLRI